MTNATKTLLITFISLVVLTALVKWTSGPASSEAFSTTLVDVDTAQVNRVVIEKPTEDYSIRLVGNSSGWKVARSDRETEYEADTDLIRRAVDRLTDLNVKAVVTRDPDKFTRYKVDSTGTKISLFRNDELLAGIVVGAPQFVGRREFNNYVRPVDEEAVYSVEGLLESTFNRNLDQWRNKQVWEVDRKRISRVEFMFPADSSYSIQRAGDQQWVSQSDTLNWSGVNTVLNRLESLRAGGFVDSLSASNFGKELYGVQLHLEDGSQRTIKLKVDDQDDSNFIATATGFPYVFSLNKSSWMNSVLKPRSELLK